VVVELVQLIALAAEQVQLTGPVVVGLVQLIALVVEPERLLVRAAEPELGVVRVVARGPVLAAAEPAPCPRRDRLAVARIALAIKISGAVPAVAADLAGAAVAAAATTEPAAVEVATAWEAAASAAAAVVAAAVIVAVEEDVGDKHFGDWRNANEINIKHHDFIESSCFRDYNLLSSRRAARGSANQTGEPDDNAKTKTVR
jgi:hypothetical protein